MLYPYIYVHQGWVSLAAFITQRLNRQNCEHNHRLVCPALAPSAAVEKSDTVTRVVLTSSVAAVYPTADFSKREGKRYTEEDWNTVATEKVSCECCWNSWPHRSSLFE